MINKEEDKLIIEPVKKKKFKRNISLSASV